MISEKIAVNNSGSGMNEALALTDRTAQALGLSRKDAFHLRLLAEEMLGMVRAITGDFMANFWLENDGKDCTLHISAKSDMDYQKRKDMLSVSTTGKNTANVGIMEKVRSFFEAGLWGMEEGFRLQAQYSTGIFGYGAIGLDAGMTDAMTDAMYSWSMQKYKSDVENAREDNPDAWDELEKSIIANIADDVNVGVRRDGVELSVHKNFA